MNPLVISTPIWRMGGVVVWTRHTFTTLQCNGAWRLCSLTSFVRASDGNIHLLNRGAFLSGVDVHLLNRVSIVSGVSLHFPYPLHYIGPPPIFDVHGRARRVAWHEDALRRDRHILVRRQEMQVYTITGGVCMRKENKNKNTKVYSVVRYSLW